MTHARAAGFCVALLAAAGALVHAADVKVTPLVTDGHVFASWSAPDAFSSDASDVVKSGLPLSVAFQVELRRPLSWWFDRTIDDVTLVSSVKLDTLTGTYQVTKRRDDKVIWSDTTVRDDQMRAWVTAFDRVPLDVGEPLEANAEYYVQIHVHTSPHRSFPLWPWGHDDGSGRADFTFVR